MATLIRPGLARGGHLRQTFSSLESVVQPNLTLLIGIHPTGGRYVPIRSDAVSAQ